MGIPFLTRQDVQEIGGHAFRAFVSTFKYEDREDGLSDSEEVMIGDMEMSDASDIDTFDPLHCNEITKSVEEMVDDSWKDCQPLENVFGKSSASLIKRAISQPTDDADCVGINVHKALTSGEDRNLISSCTAVCYWCCCETLHRVSSTIANATLNLIE